MDSFDESKVIKAIGHIRTPFDGKFGIPRQGNMVSSLRGTIVFCEDYRNPEALRGIEGFSHLWLVWGFHLVDSQEGFQPTVRPPRLGGNQRLGVFATRSPFRPNGLGLSVVEFVGLESTQEGTVLHVAGADLADGTPIYDIKPYVAFVDAIPNASSGFASEPPAKLQVEAPQQLLSRLGDDAQALCDVLACDPRPAFHDDPQRVYGFPFAGHEVRFRVDQGTAILLSVD